MAVGRAFGGFVLWMAGRGDSRQSRCGAPGRHRCSSGIAPLKRPNRASTHEGPALSTNNLPRLWCRSSHRSKLMRRRSMSGARQRASAGMRISTREGAFFTSITSTPLHRISKDVAPAWRVCSSKPSSAFAVTKPSASLCTGGNRPAAASGRPTPDRPRARATPPTSRRSPRCTPLQRQGRASSFVTPHTGRKVSAISALSPWGASARG